MDLAKWQSSQIYLAVQGIVNGNNMPFKYRLSAILHTVDQDYKIMRVLSEVISRDYINNMMDDCLLEVMLPLGDYAYLVWPNKDNMELTITKQYLQTFGDDVDPNQPIEQIRYKCMLDPVNPTFTTSDLHSYDQQTMNNAPPRKIRFRLMDRNVEPLRVLTIQGIFRGVTVDGLIKAILLGQSQTVKIDGKPAVTGMDMVKPDNTGVISQVIIESGTIMTRLPTILQKRYGGVYKYDIGTYYQRYNDNTPTWFVYPLYDHDRFDNGDEQTTATFYFAPPKYYRGVERTYRVNGNSLEVVVTTDKHQHDRSDSNQLNRGIGVRFADPSAFMLKPVQVDANNNPIAQRANLNNEVGYINRSDGLNYAPTIFNPGSNMYHETSKISRNQTTVVHFGWDNGDESRLKPGMAVKLVYLQDDTMCYVKGTLANVQVMRHRDNAGFAEQDRFLTKMVLSVSAELNTTLPDYDVEQSFDQTSSQNN